MAEAMLVDVLRPRWFVVLGIGYLLALIAALLLGGLGPGTYEREIDYAYECAGKSHVWDPQTCGGRQLSKPGEFYTYRLPGLERLNGFWSMVMYPYTTDDDKVVETLRVHIKVWGRAAGDSKNKVITEHTTKETMLCDNGANHPCWGFVMVYEDTIKYPYYEIEIDIPDDEDNQEAKALIGDVAFEYTWYNVSFIEEQLTIRVVFLVLATGAIFAFWFRMRNVGLHKWTMEQRCIGFLLLTLICLNNPLYPLEYLVSGWFFPVVDAGLQVFHTCTNMLFWLFAFDFIRRDGKFDFKGWRKPTWDWLKPIVVVLFGLFTFAFFVWFRVSQQIDPVFGDSGAVSGLVVMFFLAALMFGAIMVWILVIMMLTIPTVIAKPDYMARYLFLAVPTALCLFSIIGALFFGSFGPVRRTAMSFCYFYTLYNCYILVLTVGYWPVESKSFANRVAQPSEATPIFRAFQEGTKKEDSDEDFGGGDDDVYGDDGAL